MRRSSEPEERAQFTVAELLARYGDPAPTAGRRHRRAVDDAGTSADTAARPDVPVNGVDRRQPTLRPSSPLLATDAAVRHGSPRTEPTRSATQSESTSTQPNLNGGIRRDGAPAVGSPSVAAQRAPLAPPVKKSYALRDMERSARFHDLPFRLPTRFPASSHLPARAFYCSRRRLCRSLR